MFRLTLGLHFIITFGFIYLLKIHQLQIKEKILRDSRKNKTKHEVVEGKRNLLCGKCKAYACSTDDIRIIKVCFCKGTYIRDHQGSQHYWTNCIVYQCGSGLLCANWRRIEILSKSLSHRNHHDYFCSMIWYDRIRHCPRCANIGYGRNHFSFPEAFLMTFVENPRSSTTYLLELLLDIYFPD